MWWLLAAVVLLLVLAGVLLVRRHNRRRAWTQALAAATEQAAWFARALIPSLGQASSLQQMARTWQASSARVTSIEQQLTALESTAVGHDRGTQARLLRDAVRSARVRLETLLSSSDASAVRTALATSASEIETALAAIPPVIDASGRPPQTNAGPPG